MNKPKTFIRFICFLVLAAVLFAGTSVSALSEQNKTVKIIVEPDSDILYFGANNYKANATTTAQDDRFQKIKLSAFITNAWDCLANKINLTSFSLNLTEFKNIYFELIEQNPAYFYVTNKFACYYDPSTEIVSFVEPVYTNSDKSAVYKMQNDFNNAIFDIVDSIDDSLSEDKIILAVHDYIVTHCEYDIDYYYLGKNTSQYNTTAYGCLVEHSALCEGYSRAFAILMDFYGIECSFVPSDKMGHTWNMVKTNGNYYHIDLTWDDTLMVTSNKPYNQLGICAHKYFLKTDSQMLDADHSSWSAEHKSTVPINGIWEGVSTEMIYLNGIYYYVNANGEIVSYDNSANKTKILQKLSESKWGKEGNTYYKWSPSSAKLVYRNGRMYFSTNDTVNEINMKTGEVANILTDKDETKCITGLGFVNGKLCYDQRTRTTFTGKIAITQSIEKIKYNSARIYNAPQIGDFNGDKTVNQKDLLMLRRLIENGSANNSADLNRDGKINEKDILVLKKYLANLIYVI